MSEEVLFTVTRVEQVVSLDNRGNPVRCIRTWFVLSDAGQEYYVDVPETTASKEAVRQAILNFALKIADLYALTG